jgi:two-component system response regulator AtoC
MDTILVIDDDPGFRKLLETILSGEGYTVETGASVAEAIRAGNRRQFDLVISDLKLPDGDGLQILRWWKEHMPETPVIMVTGFGTVASAVEAMKLGAVDYLGKPLSSPDELRLLVEKALEQRRIAEERRLLREEEAGRFSCGSIVAGDPKMVRVLELVRKVAPTNATVLITGESGTGKELIARCIHANSPRAQKIFVPVNCAALSPTLIESELFGHERGAFTGAAGQHAGRFERAHGGTLFLDEIGELDANLQAKLLRVLQEKTFERVGGARQISVDVRVIAATNRNLKQAVAEGKFREDLYYRLNLFPIEVPPLRERPADIPRLARFFLARAAQNLGKPNLMLTPEAERVLAAYAWPGNVRELENTMERVAILCDEAIEPDDLPVTSSGPARPVLFKDIERQAIEDALRANDGNRTRTARQLGISLRTLQYRLKEYGITPAKE